MRAHRTDSATHIAFKDGTSSASAQPVIETTAPSDVLASMMANWARIVPSNVEPTTESPDRPVGKRKSRRAI
jgi:hypothetical protein